MSTVEDAPTATDVQVETTEAEVVRVTPDALREKIGATSPSALVPWMNQLIYGFPGAGKTTLGGTAEDSGVTQPVLFVDIDGGVTTIRHRNVDVVPIRSRDQLNKLYADLHSSIDTATMTMPYKCMVLDTVTELQKLDMAEIMKAAPGVINGKQDPSVPSQREWAISQDHIRKIIRAFRDLPCHTFFMCHASMVLDDKNRQTFGPDLPGKLRNQVAGFVDIVGYLYAAVEDGTPLRKLQVAATDTVLAKDRFDVLPDVMINPSIPDMWSLIQGENLSV